MMFLPNVVGLITLIANTIDRVIAHNKTNPKLWHYQRNLYDNELFSDEKKRLHNIVSQNPNYSKFIDLYDYRPWQRHSLLDTLLALLVYDEHGSYIDDEPVNLQLFAVMGSKEAMMLTVGCALLKQNDPVEENN